MMKLFTPILILFISATAFGQTIQNPSFEDWSTNVVNGYDTLDYWNADFDYFNEDNPLIKTNDAQDGDASVLIQTPTFGSYGMFDNLAYGELDEDALIGYYKSEIAEADSAEIKVAYIKKNGNEVTSSSMYIKTNASEWTFFQLRLQKTQNADSIQLYFSNTTTGGASKLWIDNISWGTYVSLAEQDNEEINFTVYPNPATAAINIVLNDENATIEVLSTSGQVVSTITSVNSANGISTINTAAMNPGIYFVKVSSNKGSMVKRVVIK